MLRCSFSPSTCLSQFQHTRPKQILHLSALQLGCQQFTTSSIVHIRHQHNLKFRKIRNAGGSIVKLRWTGRKFPHSHWVRKRIQLGVQWQRQGLYRSTRTIRGVSRVRYIRKERKLHDSAGTKLGQSLGKQPVRTKYVWLGDWATRSKTYNGVDIRRPLQQGSFNLDSSWTTKYHSMTEKGESTSLYLSLRYPHVEQLVRRYAGLNMSIRLTHLAWMHVPPQHRFRIWQDVMLWCLRHSAARALRLLLASMKGHQLRPPRHVVGDCLQYLARALLHKIANPDPWALNAIYHLVQKYVQGGGKAERVQYVPDQVIFLMLKHCDDERVLALLKTLASENVQLHANTLLHAVTRALDMGDVNLSLRLLKLVSKSGIGMQRDQVLSACVRLVRAKFDIPDPYAVQTRVLTQILEMGVRPNITLFNAILLNTVEAGHFELALKMFDMAAESDLKPNGITYRILLRKATEKGDRSIIHRIEGNINQFHDLSTISELLYAISKTYEPSFPRMLGLYKQHCDLRPLEELGLCEVDAEFDRNARAKDIWPSPAILGQMICSYIQYRQHDLSTLERTYSRLHDLTLHNHPLLSPVSRTDHVANAFIKAFGRDAKTLPHCTTVIKHMLDDSSSRRLSVQPDVTFPKAAAPTVRTWSILSAAYFFHKQKRAAEKVLALMHERGLEPDQVTWNTIISGYSSLQQLKETVDAVNRMEAAGYEANARTLKALGKIWNRDRLLDALGRNLGEYKAEKDQYRKVMERQQAAMRDEMDEMATGWETDIAIPGLEVHKYLKQRYQILAAEQRRRDVSEAVNM